MYINAETDNYRKRAEEPSRESSNFIPKARIGNNIRKMYAYVGPRPDFALWPSRVKSITEKISAMDSSH